MLREITLGQYYQAESRLHRLDPRVKLAGTLIFIISLFISQKVSCYVVATVFLICSNALPVANIAKDEAKTVFPQVDIPRTPRRAERALSFRIR